MSLSYLVHVTGYHLKLSYWIVYFYLAKSVAEFAPEWWQRQGSSLLGTEPNHPKMGPIGTSKKEAINAWLIGPKHLLGQLKCRGLRCPRDEC